jgi:hypothetical protein
MQVNRHGIVGIRIAVRDEEAIDEQFAFDLVDKNDDHAISVGDILYVIRRVTPEELPVFEKRWGTWASPRQLYLVLSPRGFLGVQREDVLYESTVTL